MTIDIQQLHRLTGILNAVSHRTELYAARQMHLWGAEDEQKHPRDEHGRWAHTMSRGEYHQQEKQKPGYDVSATNKAYWAQVKQAAAEGKDVHPKADEEHRQIFGEAVPRPQKQTASGEVSAGKNVSNPGELKTQTPQATPAAQTLPNPNKQRTTIVNGDEARFTGQTQVIGGGTFHEVELLEGHRKGQTALVRDEAEKTAEAQKKKDEFNEQQAGFSRLHDAAGQPGSQSGKKPPANDSPSAAKMRSSLKRALVEDFGEKIGGARKDDAKKIGPRAKKADGNNDERPAWARRYNISLVEKSTNKAEEGKWSITDEKDKNYWGMPREKGIFDSKEAAEKALPLIAAKRNHRVSVISGNMKDGNRVFGIVRNITDHKRAVVKGGFKSEDEANQYMAAHPAEIIEHQFPRYEDYAYLDHVERKGPEHKTLGKDVTPADFQKAFQFRGGEFGNWQSVKDGITSLNHAYDALHDLSDALGLPAKSVALNGDLAIAFGARGTGGKNSARAHYEPDASVMNLTKLKGAGSLAHEWAHALDHHLEDSSERHTAISNPSYKTKIRAEVAEAAKALRNAMNGKQIEKAVQAPRDEVDELEELRKQYPDRNVNDMNVVGPTTVAGHLHNLKRNMNGSRRWKLERSKKPYKPLSAEENAEWDALAKKINEGDYGDKKYTESGLKTYDNIEKLNALHKKLTGAGFHRKDKSRWSPGEYLVSAIDSRLTRKELVAKAAEGVTEKKTIATDYLNQAHRMDSTQTANYYSEPHEMFARAFEAYVADKLHEKGIRSDYLVSRRKTDNAAYAAYDLKPYPEGEERKSINAAFDRFFVALKHQTRQDDKGEHVQLYSRITDALNRQVERYANFHADQNRGKDGRWSSETADADIEKLKPVEINIPEHWKTLTIEELRDVAEKEIQRLRKSNEFAKHPKLGKVLFSGKGERKTIKGSNDPAKLFVVADIKRLIESAIHVKSDPPEDADKERSTKAYHTLVARAKIGASEYPVIVTVRRDTNGQFHYNHLVFANEKSPLGYPARISPKEDQSTPAFNGLESFVRPQLRSFKTDSKKDDRHRDEETQKYSRLTEAIDRETYARRIACFVEKYYGWDESKHPRGQPENAGEFARSANHVASDGGEARQTDHSTLTLKMNDAFRQWISKARHKPGEREARHEEQEQFKRLVDETLNTDISQPPTRLFDPQTSTPEPGERPGLLKVHQLKVDPSRFQYKMNVNDSSGVTKQFDDVEKFNPMLSGTIHVWTDTNDGNTYVVNGHHRYELAQRTGFEGDLQVYHLNAKDSKEARALGALINIAGGNGTSVDAAKFMRDTNSSIDQLKQYGVSPSGQVAKEGVVLSKLSPRLFDKLSQGLFDKNRAVAIATHVTNPDDQDKLANHIDKYEERTGRDATDGAVAQMAKKMALAGRRKHSEKNLFGEEEFDDPTFVERSELEAGVRRDIASRASKFGAVSTAKAASVLEGRNQIDAEANKSEAERLRQLLDDFDRETSYSGPISDAFNEAARRLADAPRERAELIKELGITIAALLSSSADRRAETSAIQSGGESSGSRSEVDGGLQEHDSEQPVPIKPLEGQKGFFSRLRSEMMASVERYAGQRGLFNDSEPRDDHGRWTIGGSKSTGSLFGEDDEPAPRGSSTSQPKKEAIAGQQQGLFDRGEFTTGQRSLFNVVQPSASKPKSKQVRHEDITAGLDARTREFLAKKSIVSPADRGIVLQQPALEGQREMFARRKHNTYA